MHNKTLTDLDEAAQQVRSSLVRTYIAEAIAAYRSGAYRAAIISTWISICTDIIEKLQELANSGDKNAEAKCKSIDAIAAAHDIKRMLDFERDVLDIATDEFEFLSPIERNHLSRLRDDRHLCAHPSFEQNGKLFSPTPELARLYIVQACEYLLIHPPTQGKSLIDTLLSVIAGASFPNDIDGAYSVLKSQNYLGGAKDVVHRNFLLLLLKAMFKQQEKITKKNLEKLVVSAVAVGRIKPVVYSDILREKFDGFLNIGDDRVLKRALYFLKVAPDPWVNIDEAQKVRLRNICKSANKNDLLVYELPRVQITELSALASEAVTALPLAEKDEVLRDLPCDPLKGVAIKTFIEAGSFDAAYSAGVKILLQYTEYMSVDDLEAIFQGSLENRAWGGINQILNAGGIGEVFAGLYAGTKTLNEAPSAWEGFWAKLVEAGHQLQQLKDDLIADGVIGADEEAEVEPANE